MRCGVVVVARNEERKIESCLKSLRSQTASVFTVVVNDGSRDATGTIASTYADTVVDLPFHSESWVGMPRLATVFNAGFDVLRDRDDDYVLVSGADSVYPANYVEEVINGMKKQSAVLASGVAEGEVSRSLSPRGSGRVLDAIWFRKVGFRYPENYGFEVYIVYKALSEGRNVAVFQGLSFRLSRGTEVSETKSYLWGKGMRSLHYWWLYALGRCILTGARNPSNGLAMLNGYVSGVSKRYDDLSGFVPKFQKANFARRIREVF